MLRTHTCGELREKDVGKKVTLCGWAQTVRAHGGVVFIDIRDRYGLTQIVIIKKNSHFPFLNRGTRLHVIKEWIEAEKTLIRDCWRNYNFLNKQRVVPRLNSESVLQLFYQKTIPLSKYYMEDLERCQGIYMRKYGKSIPIFHVDLAGYCFSNISQIQVNFTRFYLQHDSSTLLTFKVSNLNLSQILR